jgi:DNA-binding MarR family transcriptional regulator
MIADTTVLKQHKGYWLNRLRSLVHQSFEERLEKHDVSVASWCVLVSVYDNSARSTSELAQYIEIDKASISRVIEKLIQKGLLIQTAGKDKRSGSISLTQKGMNLVPQLIRQADENERFFWGALTNQESDSLKQMMQKIFIKSSKVRLDGWLK